ncbi:MAG: DUF2470 domain-containing protein [Mycetocola sp.]
MTAVSDFLDDPAARSIVTYMNEEQSQSCLLIAQAHDRLGTDAAVTMTAVHHDHVEFQATSAGESTVVSVPWLRPVSSRGEVRVALMDLLEDALSRLSQ